MHHPNQLLHILAALAVGALLPATALAARSDWADAGNALLRLLALPVEGGTIRGGVEIALAPGWHTYWRNPGDAGVPPRFDFSTSDNVAAAEVQFPTPERLDDGTSVSAIYADQVVFPIVVTPKDADLPVTLRLGASFGVCKDVCIPAQAQAQVAIPNSPDDDPLSKATLAEAAMRLPGPPSPGRFAIDGVAADGESLAIAVRAPDASYADLFADGPAGWPLGQPRFLSRQDGVSRYSLSLRGRPPSERVRGQTFRFVAVSGSEAIEETVKVP